MRISRSSALVLLLAFALVGASTALAAAPQPSIFGAGSSPSFDDYLPNFMTMSSCGGPIGTGWGVSTTNGWLVSQQFVPTITDTPLGVLVGLSANGFSSCDIMATIYTDAGGGVPGTLICTSSPVPVTGLPTYPTAKKVGIRFQSGGITLIGGTSYIMVFECPTNACFVVGNGTNACTGVAYQSLNAGVTWNNLGVDLCHKLVGL